ncbi:C2H2-like zinc finger protein [Quillaja saponaria]|uniref:C2H2-like zinc finger protein n=1 Tax=Quillaja saponaria TaxID=32244 RepID=A0AAD7LE65_QUISA|nr:C2H2-like zinc finger protein [Quillaja saponaria]
MKMAMVSISVLFIFILSFQEIIHVAYSSPLPHEDQSLEESTGARFLKQEQENAHEVHCSRERSRAAWKVIEEYLMPFVEEEDYQISTKCRLHPSNDIFRDQEEHKVHVDIYEWRCGYCKKSFRAEKFLDQHFDNRHYSLLNSSYGKCLADLCGALHCDAVMKTKSSKTKCNPAASARNRHFCESLADSCFPVNQGPAASRLNELFLHQFCDAHSCSGKQKPFSRGGRKQKSLFYLASAALTLVLLPVFYLFVYLVQRDMRGRTQELRRISQVEWKKKPS